MEAKGLGRKFLEKDLGTAVVMSIVIRGFRSIIGILQPKSRKIKEFGLRTARGSKAGERFR
jgi:hypothetical protein